MPVDIRPTIHLALIDSGLAPALAERWADTVAARVLPLVNRRAAAALRRRAAVLVASEPDVARALDDIATGLER